jgi:predicted O-methyltransferase YrrM
MIKLKHIYIYLKWFSKARHWKGFGIHSPFAYSFVKDVIYDNFRYPEYAKVNSITKQIKKEIKDAHITSPNKTSYVDALKIGVRRKERRLLFRIVKAFKLPKIIELGTGAGFSTSSMALANEKSNIVTLDNNSDLQCVVKKVFEKELDTTTTFITQSFDEVLEDILQQEGLHGMVFVDGNHKKEATINYFETIMKHATPETIIAFHDIHWPEEMNDAWNYIKKDARVKITFDLFNIGIIFFNPGLQKQDYNVIF